MRKISKIYKIKVNKEKFDRMKKEILAGEFHIIPESIFKSNEYDDKAKRMMVILLEEWLFPNRSIKEVFYGKNITKN